MAFYIDKVQMCFCEKLLNENKINITRLKYNIVVTTKFGHTSCRCRQHEWNA